MNDTCQKYRAVLVALVVASAALFVCMGCSKNFGGNKAPEETVETLYAVNTYRISAGNLDAYLEFGGDVASVSSVDVLPDMSGKISRILVNVGDMVTRDQVIAFVDASRPGMTYSASPVKAPIAGRVTSFSPSIGTMVSQSMSIAKISKTDDLEIKTSVAERFVSRIRLGQSAVATFDAYPGVEFEASVFEVSPVLDTTTRTMAIKLRLIQPDDRIKVGMYARVRLITESIHNAIVIPTSAIVSRGDVPYVFVIDRPKTVSQPATVKLVPIALGITVDDRTEVIEGITAKDEIVVKGQSLLNEGSKVNIVAVME